jgi:SAM-dependent methyltransferase
LFSSYKDIFDQRGASYHQAMLRYPDARKNEFDNILSLARPKPGEILVDLPSGGGYLKQFIQVDDVEIVEVETSRGFHDRQTASGNVRNLLCNLDAIPLEDASADILLSLAGLHHVDNLPDVFREAYRILKPEGRFCLADVQAGSDVDHFLNGFVDAHNSMGHQGSFIDEDFIRKLADAGFVIDVDELRSYSWDFPSPQAMAEYCTLLFGMDKADAMTVINGISEHQGFRTEGRSCRMFWQLRFIRGLKTD